MSPGSDITPTPGREGAEDRVPHGTHGHRNRAAGIPIGQRLPYPRLPLMRAAPLPRCSQALARLAREPDELIGLIMFHNICPDSVFTHPDGKVADCSL